MISWNDLSSLHLLSGTTNDADKSLQVLCI